MFSFLKNVSYKTYFSCVYVMILHICVKYDSDSWCLSHRTVLFGRCCAQLLQRTTLYAPMDCNPPGSSVHGIFQAGILEWVAMPSSRGPSLPRDGTCISCIAGGFTTEPQGEIQSDESTHMFKNMTSDSWFLSYSTCSLWEEGGPNAQRSHSMFFETQINNLECNQLLNQILFACIPLLPSVMVRQILFT